MDSFDEFIVPEGQYYFLGDNRDQSNDSRFIGTVALEGIYGRVSFIALSVDPERYYRPRIERWLRPLDIEFERPL
jgi:signal peptidase I